MSSKVSVLFCFLTIVGCSTSSSTTNDAGDARVSDVPSSDVVSPDGSFISDGSIDGAMCTYLDAGAPGDAGTFNSFCPAAGCPSGSICVREVGGVAGEGGGEYCAPIPNECHGTPTCACMADCVCTHRFGGFPEACSDQNGSIDCNDGII